MAMATGVSAAAIQNDTGAMPPNPAASARAITRNPASSQNVAVVNAGGLALARQDFGTGFSPMLVRRAVQGNDRASDAQVSAIQPGINQAPSISPGGVVPLFGTASVIQPGEWISIYGSNLASVTATWD